MTAAIVGSMKHKALKNGYFSGSFGFKARIQSTFRQACLELPGIRDR
jgi:hypothetical protein